MLLCSLPLFTNGQQSVCTRRTTSTQAYQYYAEGSYQVSYSCGFLWLSTCYRSSYNSQVRYGTKFVYDLEVVCCSGYSSVGGDCLPTCPNCP
ncbi:hypothetical protein GBAR_LOCUS16703 [Geodia barretti]|uniref:Uncharacterized protein n=1 Tax=Geodia barretti TaxID=519541 RepID=A0AA35SG06_GEOBA|nr:hypothetical protein GBAR_LOCUS16703 [Geodia barretti]